MIDVSPSPIPLFNLATLSQDEISWEKSLYSSIVLGCLIPLSLLILAFYRSRMQRTQQSISFSPPSLPLPSLPPPPPLPSFLLRHSNVQPATLPSKLMPSQLMPSQLLNRLKLEKKLVSFNRSQAPSFQPHPAAFSSSSLSLEQASVFHTPNIAQNILQFLPTKKHALAFSTSAVSKSVFQVRFYHPQLRHFHFKHAAQVENFLFYCQNALTGQPRAIRQPEDLQIVNKLTLNIFPTLTLEQCEPLFDILRGVEYLKINLYTYNFETNALNRLLKKSYSLGLIHLKIKGIKYSPSKLWKMHRLKTLHLAAGFQAKLSIPDDIEQFSALTSLELCNFRQIHSLPKGFWTLRQLEELTLNNVGITELQEIGSLSALKKLQLIKLPIEKLPTSLKALKSLEKLTLDRLQIAHIEQLNHLETLKKLRLNDLPIEELPASLATLKHLEKLTLNRINIRHFKQLSQLTALQSLSLSRLPYLENLPDNIGELQSLEILLLESLSITVLPETIGQLSQLKILQLNTLAIKNLPHNLAGLEKLEDLFLAYSPHIKHLPEEIGQLPALKRVDLRNLPELRNFPQSLLNPIWKRRV